ncbi:hypothetical protein RYX36_034932 [Vicia faba]
MKLQRVMIMLMMVEGIERITIFGDELILFVVVDFRSVYAGCGICCHNSSGVSTWFQGPLMDEDKNVGKLKMKDIDVKFDMTSKQKVVFGCLQVAHVQNFLLAIPIDGTGQHMSSVEYRIILRYHFMILLFPSDEICPVCRKTCLDTFGKHMIHCRELRGFKYQHNLIRDVLFDIF